MDTLKESIGNVSVIQLAVESVSSVYFHHVFSCVVTHSKYCAIVLQSNKFQILFLFKLNCVFHLNLWLVRFSFV